MQKTRSQRHFRNFLCHTVIAKQGDFDGGRT
jgi:hypothetical protein